MKVMIIAISFPWPSFLDEAADKHLNAMPEGQLPAALPEEEALSVVFPRLVKQ